jgi:oxysterol-binding protein 1
MSEGEEQKDCSLDEPKERTELPWFKDPNVKVSIWAIIKDSIGKDISKLTVPVYFNDPTSLLQKCAQSMEYNSILDQAALIDEPGKRLAWVAVYAAA